MGCKAILCAPGSIKGKYQHVLERDYEIKSGIIPLRVYFRITFFVHN